MEGSINIEGSLSWPSTYHVAGDVHEMAVTRAADNLLALWQGKDSGREM